jgi:TIR domain
MPGIFISYRRKDTGGHAGHLKANLDSSYGRRRVFMDVDSIPAGKRYADPIEDALDSCKVALVLIGESWLAPVGPEQTRRIDNEGDWVRREVVAALKRPDVAVIPLLVEGAAMPKAGELPPDMVPLADIQACNLHNGQWSFDLERLRRTVDAAAPEGRWRRFFRQPARRYGAGGAVLTVAVAATAIALSSGGGGGGPTCQNQTLPAKVRAELSEAQGTKDPALKGVLFGSCGADTWAVARFPHGQDGVFKRTGFSWTRLGPIAGNECKVPSDLRGDWTYGGC